MSQLARNFMRAATFTQFALNTYLFSVLPHGYYCNSAKMFVIITASRIQDYFVQMLHTLDAI